MTKMIKTINDEETAFDYFATYPHRPVFIPETIELEYIFSIINDAEWRDHWTISSNKSDPPPDFFSQEYSLMMEMMIVDDHARMESGKVINPQKKADFEAYDALKKASDSSLFDQVSMIHINSLTDLPSSEDHNYTYYLDEFKRVVSKHKEKIKIYRGNHPNYKLIFFIQDESSLYFEIPLEYHDSYNRKEETMGRYHFPFVDRRMVSILMGSDIDYVVWWMPYRLSDSVVPTVAIFKPNELIELVDYEKELILSSEE